jgi:hypothetical protein
VTIPDALATGWLPVGVFDATLEELKERFGCFRLVERRATDRRTHMFAALVEYFDELKAWEIVDVVYIDGSFISNNVEPGDVDVTFFLPDEFLLRPVLKPAESNLVERAFTKRVYGVDLWVEPTAAMLERRVQTWQRKKPPLKGTKGLVRVTL